MRLALLVALAVLLSPPARACSVCGCDPSSGTLGLDRPTEGDLRLGVEDRYLQKESGTVADGTREGEREDRLNLRVQWAPRIPRLSFQFELPVYAWKAHAGLDGATDDTSRGLGDISAGARYEIVRLGGMSPRHVVALTASLKAPTGVNAHLAPVDNGVFDEHKQLGTGSWDSLLGAFYTFGDFPTVAYAGLSARINGSNARGNHYGNALFATAGVRRSFLETRSLFFSLDAQVRNAGLDSVPVDGGRALDPNSGGMVTYAALGAGYALTRELLVRGTLQVPVVTALNGAQSEHPVGYLALAYDLSL